MVNYQQCLRCGCPTLPNSQNCPKCGSFLKNQTDGTIVTKDIAHNLQTVDEAMILFKKILEQESTKWTKKIRLIVGSGKIREALIDELEFLKKDRQILKYNFDGQNQGAIIIQIK